MQNDRNFVAKTLTRHFNDFKNGNLNNEPARLLCNFFEHELDISEERTPENAISEWLDSVNLTDIGRNGELGGINVTQGVDGHIVEYCDETDCTWLSADALIELADEADKTNNPTPLPDWFEPSWIGITHEVAIKLIEKMDEESIIHILDHEFDYAYEFNEVENHRRWGWTNDPREALIHRTKNLPSLRLAQIFGLL